MGSFYIQGLFRPEFRERRGNENGLRPARPQ
jgi:hypothetical protein